MSLIASEMLNTHTPVITRFFTAQQISTKMPASIFLHWNSVPDLNSTPSPSPSSPHKLHSRTQNGKVEENVSPASVVASVDQTSGTYSWPYLLKPANQRSAKYAARMKLKERLEVQDANPRSHQRKRNEVSSQAKKPKGRKRSSLGVGRTKTKRPPVEDSFCWFEYTKRRPRSLPPLSPISKFALKELSIPIQRIPVRIRKKMTDNSATRSSSISSSTVDSSTELSSRSSVSPLNSSKTSIIQ